MKTTAILLFSAATLGAGELSPNQIPPNTKWLAHVDLEAMRSSETGRLVFERIEADHGAKLRAVKRMFSLHPLKDLRDVTMFGDGRKDHAVLLLDGTFDREHIDDLLGAADDYKESDHHGVTVRSWKDKGITQFAAFATPELIVFSRQEDLLRQELDTLKANTTAADTSAILPAAGSKPLIAMGAKLSDIEMPKDAARMLQTASLLKLGASENNGRFSIEVRAEAADAKHARRVQRMLDGVMALAEAGNADLSTPGFQCDIGSSDQSVNALVSMPVNEWLEFLKKEADKNSKKP